MVYDTAMPDAAAPAMPAPFRVHSARSAGHWIAWITEGAAGAPCGDVVLIGQTQEEAEANARQWANRLASSPWLRRD